MAWIDEEIKRYETVTLPAWAEKQQPKGICECGHLAQHHGDDGFQDVIGSFRNKCKCTTYKAEKLK